MTNIIDAAQPAVTIVTARAASADELSAADYRDIYAELRSKCPLRQFTDLIHSAVSFAWWSKYERGEADLNHDRRNELRAAVGLPALPPAVSAVTAAIDPDATVYLVGAGAPDRVVMVGAETTEPLTMRLNGNLRIVADEPAPTPHVTGVTRPRDRSNYSGLSIRRETKNRLADARRRSGLTWDEFVARAGIVDDLVAALREVDLYLDIDPDVEDAPWGDYEHLAATVHRALKAVRKGA